MDAFLAELNRCPISHYHPAIEVQPWGWTMPLLDPFGNRLIFLQRSRGENA